jgi:hypothetical protein
MPIQYTSSSTVTDHTSELQQVLDSAEVGDTIILNGSATIQGNLTIPFGIKLLAAGSQNGHRSVNTNGDFSVFNGTIFLSSTATIFLKDCAVLEGFVIIRAGLVTPFTSAALAQAGISAFAGTAISITGHDVVIEKNMILGFAKAIYSDGFERPTIKENKIDCTNGIELANSLDVARVTDCHVWPFLTAHRPWVTSALLTRTGTAFKFRNRTDWVKVQGCFSYGWYRGFNVFNSSSLTFISCSADGPSGTNGLALQAHSIGWLIEGSYEDIRLIGCQSTNKATGYYINGSSPTKFVTLTACDAAAGTQGVALIGGSLSHASGVIRACTNGYLLANTQSRLNSDPSVFISDLRGGSALANTVGNTFHRFNPTMV